VWCAVRFWASRSGPSIAASPSSSASATAHNLWVINAPGLLCPLLLSLRARPSGEPRISQATALWGKASWSGSESISLTWRPRHAAGETPAVPRYIESPQRELEQGLYWLLNS
jgi:hypothetical protein